MKFLGSPLSYILAGLCAFAAVVCGIVQILCHLRFYNEPLYQRHIIRIIFLIPVLSTTSFLCYVDPHRILYYDAVREAYEAWVIYNFLSLLLAYVGGPGAVEVKMNGYLLKPSLLFCTCCLPPLPVNGHFVKTTKRMALQFVILKPLLVVLKVALFATGNLEEGNWSLTNGLLYLTILYNVTYALALSGLMLFYRGCHDLLLPYKPLLKFIMIKAVIFITFWQSLAIALLATAGLLAAQEAFKLRSFLLCVEMLPGAILLLYAFPWNIYQVAGQPTGIKSHAVTHAMSMQDVVSDAVHHFAPQYTEYVLYSDGQTATKARSKPSVTQVQQASAGRGIDKSGLLSSMEMGSRWRTTEEGVVNDPEAVGDPSKLQQLPELQFIARDHTSSSGLEAPSLMGSHLHKETTTDSTDELHQRVPETAEPAWGKAMSVRQSSPRTGQYSHLRHVSSHEQGSPR